MIKLMKYLKPFTISIIVIICLLFVQAICNLALPEYMSKIVNNGIQQKGIENSVPDVIRKNEFDKLMLFIADEDKEKIRSFYNFLDKEQLSDLDYEEYLKDYPLLEESSLYELKALKKGEIDEINLILGKAILVSLDISENGFTLLPDKYQSLSGLDPFLIISNMSAEEKTIVMEEINKKIDQLPESIITQSSIVYIETEYESIRIDTNKLQENYIITFGLKMTGVALASMIISILVGFLASRLSAGFGRNLREKVFSKVESFSNTEFDKFGTSSLITRTTNDIMQIQTIIVMLIRVVFYAPILGLGG
ncbi:MAG: ABC transporter transmembrane domain-containing protein, partial [Bacilli bacterium]|nr:ABC transporter transmembrane domain-containing protein [Bacilli bacterium]